MARRARPSASDVPAVNGAAPELNPEEERLLGIVWRADGPVGARLAGRQLRESGLEISEATVSRIFKRLDDFGLTMPSGRKGRTLTEHGRRCAEAMSARQRHEEEFTRAFDIRTVEQLLDLLHARRGVEREIAGRAAAKATDDDVAGLEEILRRHEMSLDDDEHARQVGMNFHRTIARIAGSDLLGALAGAVLNESLLPLEKVLDVITGGHGTVSQSVPEHVEIVAAIRRRDPAAAEEAMARHLTRLIDEVTDFSRSDQVRIFDRLLMFTRQS
ncbi:MULTISPECIES: FCD domain-containing protein [unclassified Microbispora]|uniref:FCD domain-containing protein n=1 Tax=unclassified Microbispora TaxID=2614687 RepID=UPI0015FEDEF3|nr:MULTISPECIES: FCD domain-containing protein [unclassified Microbispora]